MNESERHIRKRWLVFSIICASYRLVIDAVHALYLGREIPPFAIVILMDTVPSLLLWRFAYFKAGTRWLTFTMVMALIGFVGCLEPSFIGQAEELGMIGYFLIAVDFFLTFGWFFLSFKLRRVNARAGVRWKMEQVVLV